MVNIRSTQELVSSLMDFIRLAQPNADVKPGTVIRDLMIDLPASTLSLLYDELSSVSNQQSMRLVVGSDLDKLATNFGTARKQSTFATGVALLTFSSITANINISKGSLVTAINGFSYAIASGIVVSPNSLNFYRSVASKFSDQLSTAGITDQFAVEVTVTATTAGAAGNIGIFSLNSTSIPGVSNVTNINPFTGGTDQESDSAFRNRVLASFSGSSVGTALGYLNTALSTTGVSDALVIGPGDPLMTRDGTIVQVNADGSRTILSEGSGGKVDVIELGSTLIQTTDTFIYHDKSNNNDPTNSKNDFVLGQIAADANKTVNRKRIDDIANGVLPTQPVDVILSVSGSISGSNFSSKSVNEFGIVSGNYELIKDTGVYGGSPWGFDTFHWIDNKISGFNEDLIKGQYNGQDVVSFSGLLSIPKIQQNLLITNENSTVTSDRSIIQLLHTPATNVTKVFNVNTGERYLITNQNIDNTGVTNTSGRIQISGNTLPSPNDVLQVDYTWVIFYDPFSDYDGLKDTFNPRAVSDSVDWGYASIIKNEDITFSLNVGNNFFQGNAAQPVGTVLSADKYLKLDGVVQRVTSGIFINRLSVVLSNLPSAINTIEAITLKNTNREVFVTAQNDGNISNVNTLVGTSILTITTVILPTDTIAVEGSRVIVVANSVNVFLGGSNNNLQITIPSASVNTSATSIVLRTTYVSSISDLFSIATTTLPASRKGNGLFLNDNTGFNNFSPINLLRRENQIVQKNLSNQFFVEINVPSADFTLTTNNVISVIRLSDGLEIWNPDNIGSIITGTSGNYQIIFSGFNNPQANDRVLVIYYATDSKRFQPFSYANNIIKTRVDTLGFDLTTKNFVVPINSFVSQNSSVNFNITEPNNNTLLFSVTDGILTSNGDGTANLTSVLTNLSIPDILYKKVRIINATNSNNNGIYDIIAYNNISNTLMITENLNHIVNDQISIIRITDTQEVWSYNGIIDVTNNRLLIPSSLAKAGDKVFTIFFGFKNLRKAPTKVISNIIDQVNNVGVITLSGTTLSLAQDIVFTSTSTGLQINALEALTKILNTSSVPSSVSLARIIKVEKVTTVSNSNDTVLQVLATYDVQNSFLQNNLLYDDMLSNPNLLTSEFILPNTSNNLNNQLNIGDRIRITFDYVINNDSENLTYTRNGVLYTNKKFVYFNKIYISSGFNTSQSTKFTGTSFTQPALGARYKVFYDYTAPKQNERIVITYNYNKLVGDVTFNVENSRPINADVLVREAKMVLLDLTINVVISPSLLSSTTIILQNLRNSLNTALTTNSLGQIVDVPTIINVAQAVNGIDRARVIYFNKTGIAGSVNSVQAQKDEFFAPNNIVINTETR